MFIQVTDRLVPSNPALHLVCVATITLFSLQPAWTCVNCVSQACIYILTSLYPVVFFTIECLSGGQTYQKGCVRLWLQSHEWKATALFTNRKVRGRYIQAGTQHIPCTWSRFTVRLFSLNTLNGSKLIVTIVPYQEKLWLEYHTDSFFLQSLWCSLNILTPANIGSKVEVLTVLTSSKLTSAYFFIIILLLLNDSSYGMAVRGHHSTQQEVNPCRFKLHKDLSGWIMTQ